MSRRSENIVTQAHARIGAIQDSLNAVDSLCSVTFLEQRTCRGMPGCRCTRHHNARRGPCCDWGRRQAGKLVHRRVSPEQATVLLRPALAH